MNEDINENDYAQNKYKGGQKVKFYAQALSFKYICKRSNPI